MSVLKGASPCRCEELTRVGASVILVGANLTLVGASLILVGARNSRMSVLSSLATYGWAAGCLAERSNSRHAEQRQR